MIFVNIFTYKEDEQIVALAAKSAHLTFGSDCEVHVIDDHLNPIGEQYKETLLKQGTFYRQSTFNRKKNLNGKECCIGLVTEFKNSSNGRDGITIKLDSDTLLLHRKLFDNFIDDKNCAYMASHRPGSIFSGICYCIKNHLFDKIIYNLNVIDLDDTFAPEDMVIGAITTVSAMPMSIRIINEYREKVQIGESTGWNYTNKNNREAYLLYYNNFYICTFGNWFMYNGLTKKDRIKPMKGILDIKEEKSKLNFDFGN